jgi:hypothetical protein
MSADERVARSRSLRAAVADLDVHRWADGFLESLSVSEHTTAT